MKKLIVIVAILAAAAACGGGASVATSQPAPTGDNTSRSGGGTTGDPSYGKYDPATGVDQGGQLPSVVPTVQGPQVIRVAHRIIQPRDFFR